MLTLVQRHRARMLAAEGSAHAVDGGERSGPAATEYELQRVRLGVDLRRLKEIQSIEKKIDLKRELLPHYDAWVAGVLAADSGAPDDILIHAMIWQIDIGDVAGAMPLVRYVLSHELTLPERFDRTAPTYICEEIAEHALKLLGQDQDADRAVPMEIDDLMDGADVFDQVRAKLEKAIGIQMARDAAAIAADADGPAGMKRAAEEQSLARLRRALALDPKCGVKKRADAIEATLKKSAERPAET